MAYVGTHSAECPVLYPFKNFFASLSSAFRYRAAQMTEESNYVLDYVCARDATTFLQSMQKVRPEADEDENKLDEGMLNEGWRGIVGL